MSDFKPPMLVSEIPGHVSRIMDQPHIYGQPKLDGHCCMANTVTRKIYARSGREITTLPHINAALPVDCPEWLHGELWKPGATCHTVQSMINQGDTSLEFHVFDIVSNEGSGTRMTRVIKIEMNDAVKTVPTVPMAPDEINAFYEACLARGYEGMILRLEDYGYEHKRSTNVFKLKPTTEGV